MDPDQGGPKICGSPTLLRRVKQNNMIGKKRGKSKGSLTFSPQMSISSSEGVNSMERGEAAVTRQNPDQQFNHVQRWAEIKKGRTLLNSSIMSRGGQK
jgi:hypothetical protein